MDLHNSVKIVRDWDNVLPDKLRPIWTSHFEMMKVVGNLKFHRVIIPAGAVNLNIHTIDIADASNQIACAATYARCLRINGSYSYPLIFSRSKIILDSLSQAKAKLIAATMNAHIGKIVGKSFQSNHKRKLKLAHSKVMLHWISNSQKPVTQSVRNTVLEIIRFTEPSEWIFVYSQYMIADLGARRVNDLNFVNKDSTWISGYDWMKNNQKDFSTK